MNHSVYASFSNLSFLPLIEFIKRYRPTGNFHTQKKKKENLIKAK